MQSKQIYISDTNHQTILVSSFEKEVISTKLFNRLHHISQNSTAYLTFPSNRTKRFEHSLGTMKLCGDIFYNAICNSDKKEIEEVFRAINEAVQQFIVKEEILGWSSSNVYRSILGDTNLTPAKLNKINLSEIKNVFYNSCVPNNVGIEHVSVYLIAFQAVRLCGLLHDIGHPPFSHITEYSIEKIFKEVKEKHNRGEELNQRENQFYNIVASYYDNSNCQLHEQMGNKMTGCIIDDILFSDNSWCKGKNFEYKYFKIITFKLIKLIFDEKNEILSFLHRIIDGVIDGDRLDYVNRDIKNSGINNGEIEYDRLIASTKILKLEDKFAITYDAKTINTIEDFLLKRWYLYKNIIYHHRVIKTDTLLQQSIEDIIRKYLSNTKEVEDEDTKLLPNNISGLWKAIEMAYSHNAYFDALIQWDDCWLLTILKNHYFLEFYDANNSTHFKLEELLSNRKNYHSVIKNSYDFQHFSSSFEKNISWDQIERLSGYEEINQKIPYDYRNRKMHVVFTLLTTFFDTKIEDCISKNIESYIKSVYNDSIVDTIVVFKNAKTGLSTEPIIHKFNDKFELSKLSNIKTILETEKSSYPYFYMYVNLKQDFVKSSNFESSMLEQIGEDFAKKINALIDERQKL